ncbi:hypothetical protein DPSP01_014364 [Paraphaeosphaeria sporulosa]
MATTTTTTTTATKQPLTRPAKRADSAVSLSFPSSTSTSNHTTQNLYDAEWTAYLGLEDEWGYVLKDSREVKSTRREAEAERGQQYEEEWSAYLGLDMSGEW